MGSGKTHVYLIGGGDFKKQNLASFKECRKLTQQGQSYSFEAKANMLYPRHGHSACAVGETQIVVTGGRHGAGNECELFERSKNQWRELPKLLRRRHYHSSCAFEGRSIFVFCGIDNDTRGYINKIERLQLNEGL